MPFRLVEAEVRPVFLPHPVLGDTLSFAEAGAHDMNRMQVVNALREMFGLCFYTDEPGRTVYAEPRNSSTATTRWWTGVTGSTFRGRGR